MSIKEKQFSRKVLAEELVKARRASMNEYRNDEGTVFDDNYYKFWERYKDIESQVKNEGLQDWEIEEARKRIKLGVPAGTYGEDNIFLPNVEWLTRILNLRRIHLGAADDCIKEWANNFRISTEIPINERIQMLWDCRGIILLLRRKINHISLYPLAKTVSDALKDALAKGDQVELTKVRDIFDLFDDNKINDLDLEYYLEQLAKSQGDFSPYGHQEVIKEALSKAEKLRTFDECEKVRVAIEKAFPQEKEDILKETLFVEKLVELAQRLIQLALDIGTVYSTEGDIEQAQKLWVVAQSTSEMLRFRWTGRFYLLVNRAGKPVRHEWPRRNAEPLIHGEYIEQSNFLKSIEERRQCRKASSELFSKWLYMKPLDVGKIIGSDEDYTGITSRPSLEKFIVLYYHIINDDLVVYIHNRIDRFIYGDNFSDFGYSWDKVLPDPLLCAPLIKRNVSQKIINAVQRLHILASEKKDVNKEFSETLNLLSELLSIHDVDTIIASHCINKNFRKEDILIIIVPDGPLYRIPFSFLRASNGEPLFQTYAAISSTFSLLSLKWQLMSYLQRCLPYLPDNPPRCVFVGVPETTVDSRFPSLPGVIKEWKNLITIFGNEHLFALGGPLLGSIDATINNIATYHRDAEIFWYSGHGIEENESQLTVGGLELPHMGLVLPNEVLTSDFFYRGEPWNFNSNWMVVLNSCLLGRLYERGTEVMGLLSALYLVGATSVVTCLWEVNDELAVDFAREFSKRLIQSYTKDRIEKEFVKATAFTETMRALVSQYDEVKVACYFFTGVP